MLHVLLAQCLGLSTQELGDLNPAVLAPEVAL